MNNVSLIGRFARDPELRYTSSGKAVCNFTLAVRNPFDSDGNADFIDCVSWGNAAELIAEKHEKGNMIGVDGRISKRSYENDEGVTIYITEVNVNMIHLIQTKDYEPSQSNTNQNNNNRNTNKNKSKNNSNKNKNTR